MAPIRFTVVSMR
ncbi:hypothetical protein CJF32_00002667 [Rutstroemia sp. NJR-2017a WRK4]|nr:hypothetical protein CJF32_00006296 [Rutstroemia sp. NJR-2017a WRK4]PQE11845.1 hypothetical protein CJF32_00002667 [Rutstroemia sp. NJR-2017a WRK4]